jgi:hypothetical protein
MIPYERGAWFRLLFSRRLSEFAATSLGVSERQPGSR